MNWFMPLEWSYPAILVRGSAGSRWRDCRIVLGMKYRGGKRLRHTIAVLGHDVPKLWRQELFRLGVFHEQDLSYPSAHTTSPTKPPEPSPGLQTKMRKSRLVNPKPMGHNDKSQKSSTTKRKSTANSPSHTPLDTPSTSPLASQKQPPASPSPPSPSQNPTTFYARR